MRMLPVQLEEALVAMQAFRMSVRLLDGVRAPCDPADPLACVNDASLADYLRAPRGRRWPLLPVISMEHRRKLRIEFAHFLFLVASLARHFMQRVRAFLPVGSCSFYNGFHMQLTTIVNNDKSYAYLLIIIERVLLFVAAELDSLRGFADCGAPCEQLCEELADILKQTPEVLSEADKEPSKTKSA